MIPKEVREAMRKDLTSNSEFTPIKAFELLDRVLSVAPVEEWKALVEPLRRGHAPGFEQGPLSQALLAKKLSILIFAAEQLYAVVEELAPADAMRMMAEIFESWGAKRTAPGTIAPQPEVPTNG